MHKFKMLNFYNFYACIEDQEIIDTILAHLHDKELVTPSLPLMTPPSRAPPETLPLFAGKDSSSTTLNQQGSHRGIRWYRVRNAGPVRAGFRR